MRRTLTFAVLSCALAATAGCSSTPAPARLVEKPVPFANYVSLGDSYVSGPFIAPAAKGAPPECVRSGANYPSFLAAYLKVKTFTDASCGGAETADLYASQSRRLGIPQNAKTATPAQLDALRPSTDLVTLGIGGNDFGLFQNLVGSSITSKGLATRLREADAVGPLVERALSQIHRRAPRARVVVVGYLRVLPVQGSCPGLPLKVEDRKRADSIERRINSSLAKAAKNRDATFVDSYALSKGHDACAGKEAWVNGAQNILFRAAAFHPFREGMDAVARETFTSLTKEAAPKTPSLKVLKALPR